MDIELYHTQTDRSITIYWEKTAEMPVYNTYEIYCNGRLEKKVTKTHYTFQNLKPETRYEITVKVEEQDAAGRVLTSCSIFTNKKRKYTDITKAPYFAVPDGKTMNTKVLQMAIDQCRDGETIYFPKGTYLSGALSLHSNMNIYLEKGAVLQGTADPADYLPKTWSRFEGTQMYCYRPFLGIGQLDQNAGYTTCNIVIEGQGTIASGGQKLGLAIIDAETRELHDYLEELGDRIKECETAHTIPGRVRPRLIQICNAQNIVIAGLTLKDGACWTVHMIYSDHILTHDCCFETKGVWNGDGWDPDSSTNCTLFGCEFYTEDDAVAIKSGKNPEGNIIGKPCAHIRIFDCYARMCHGIAIGSEMSGGVEDVKIWDCDLTCSQYGIEIKGTSKRGAYVRDISAIDCTVPRILIHSVSYNDDGVGSNEIPVFEKCRFDRIYITGRCSDEKDGWYESNAIDLCGFDEPGHELKDISFHNITIGTKEQKSVPGISLHKCKLITMENVICR